MKTSLSTAPLVLVTMNTAFRQHYKSIAQRPATTFVEDWLREHARCSEACNNCALAISKNISQVMNMPMVFIAARHMNRDRSQI
jgi:hypothetical protein